MNFSCPENTLIQKWRWDLPQGEPGAESPGRKVKHRVQRNYGIIAAKRLLYRSYCIYHNAAGAAVV